MERRVLLAISLSFLVLFLYQILVVPPPPEDLPRNVSPLAASPAPIEAGGNITAAPVLPAAPAVVVGDTEERDIVVETQTVRAAFTNRGGTLRHWVLKDYQNSEGQPLDLIPSPPEGQRLLLPFSLRVDDGVTSDRLNQSLYRVTGVSGAQIDATNQPATITFELETAEGLHSRKTFTIQPSSYQVEFSAAVRQGDREINPAIEWGPALGDEIARRPPGSFLSPAYLYKAQAIFQPVGADVERHAFSALAPLQNGLAKEGQFRWAGVDDHYFIAAILQPPSPTQLQFRAVAIPTMGTPPVTGEYASYSVKLPKPPENAKFYFGPKQLETLRAIDPEFTRAIYFGVFAWLAAPLLDALKWVYGFVGNWGWSIIVLTILINLALAPLRHKSVVSMRRMQELQPQMKAIQDRYAKYKMTDPERSKMNTEVMELYRSKGVNPASGCVPMLLTLPFLFAFYAMLGQAIEIRGASFGWIDDLALADPLYVTPFLMGLSMFWQQKITPSTADPTQQKIMMMMPVMITVTMLFAPAGLVIYWLVSNLWSIGQQYFTNAVIGPPKIPGSGAVVTAKSGGREAKALKDAGASLQNSVPSSPRKK